MLPGLGSDLAVEDAEGRVVGVACDNLYAVWIYGTDTGEDDVLGGVEKGRGGKVDDGGKEERVDEHVGGSQNARLSGQRE